MDEENQEKSEEPTEERRQKFREEGDVATSKEINSVVNLATATLILTFTMPYGYKVISDLLRTLIAQSYLYKITEKNKKTLSHFKIVTTVHLSFL